MKRAEVQGVINMLRSDDWGIIFTVGSVVFAVMFLNLLGTTIPISVIHKTVDACPVELSNMNSTITGLIKKNAELQGIIDDQSASAREYKSAAVLISLAAFIAIYVIAAMHYAHKDKEVKK